MFVTSDIDLISEINYFHLVEMLDLFGLLLDVAAVAGNPINSLATSRGTTAQLT